MENAERYLRWFESRGLRPPGDPDSHGLFLRGTLICALPYLRAYFYFRLKDGKGTDRPSWQPETWSPIYAGKTLRSRVEGYQRFLRADQILDWLDSLSPASRDSEAFLQSVEKLLRFWLVPVDEVLSERPEILRRRIETMRFMMSEREVTTVTKGGPKKTLERFLDLSRNPQNLPNILRDHIDGTDVVHTPESERAGLTRYLCQGWHITDQGGLEPNEGAAPWGPSTVSIPHRLGDAPRRLMLGTSLQTRAVPLADDVSVVPGKQLHCAFSALGGWTHEDAIVVSQSAAAMLTSNRIWTVRITVPTLASPSKVDHKTGVVARATPLVRAQVDLYALGLRRSDARKFRAEDGWLEIALPGATLKEDAELVELMPRKLTQMRWRELFAYRFRSKHPLRVGDKLATRHGIKGVVSKILADEEMPMAGERRAQIVLSPTGVVRRGAMGQFHEAVGEAPSEPPKFGTVFVMRQPQDARLGCRVRGPRIPHVRGQRYGEMEFWALMAHGAERVAGELLSLDRSAARWMQEEAQLASGAKVGHREVATQALNRFLAFIGAKLERGSLIAPPRRGDAFVITAPRGARLIRLKKADEDKKGGFSQLSELKKALEDDQWFRDVRGSCAVELGDLAIELRVSEVGINLRFEAINILPPWLRPATQAGLHPLTKAYAKLFSAISRGGSPSSPYHGDFKFWLRKCLDRTLDEESGHLQGAGVFLRREVLGRRLTRSARAVIVPRPDLRIDQIAIPKFVADELFHGLAPRNKELVLVNRNPTLHRRGLIAMRPVVNENNEPVFGLPLGILSGLNADFDGDQATVVALESEEALAEAERKLPGAPGLRLDPFRPGRPAFPLLKELSSPHNELRVASDDSASQERWSTLHQEMVLSRLSDVGDGWEAAREALELKPNDPEEVERDKQYKWRLLKGQVAESEWLARAKKEMNRMCRDVRQKGRLGGILRRELYKRPFKDPESFWRAVEALQAVTQPIVQSALSAKTGEAVDFNEKVYFNNSGSGEAKAALREIKGAPDPDLVAKAMGSGTEPKGLLAWMATSRLQVLLTILRDGVGAPSSPEDPRISWFLA